MPHSYPMSLQLHDTFGDLYEQWHGKRFDLIDIRRHTEQNGSWRLMHVHRTEHPSRDESIFYGDELKKGIIDECFPIQTEIDTLYLDIICVEYDIPTLVFVNRRYFETIIETHKRHVRKGVRYL